MLRDKGFTPTQLAQLRELIAEATPVAVAPVECGVRQIRFSGSLDSRELVGNITDGVVHYVLDAVPSPAGFVRGLSRWVGLS